MNREELTNRIQEGFFELAPDMFDKILEETKQPMESVALNIEDYKKKTAFYNRKEFKMLRRIAVLVIVIGLLFGIGILRSKNDEAVYVVAMDVNPSIQMELNQEYDVCKAAGLNAEGKQIIKQIKWKKNCSIQQMLGMITDKLVSEGYLKENSGILMTMYEKDQKQDCEELKLILNQELEKDVSKCGLGGVKVQFQTVNSTDHKTGQTGKEILKERLVKEYQLNQQDIKDMNIRDLFDYIEEKDSANTTQSNKNGAKEQNTVLDTKVSQDNNILTTVNPNVTTGENTTSQSSDSIQKDKKQQKDWQNKVDETQNNYEKMPDNTQSDNGQKQENKKHTSQNEQSMQQKKPNEDNYTESTNAQPPANKTLPENRTKLNDQRQSEPNAKEQPENQWDTNAEKQTENRQDPDTDMQPGEGQTQDVQMHQEQGKESKVEMQQQKSIFDNNWKSKDASGDVEQRNNLKSALED